ncbi:hypothetical protein K3495_g5700 [Podosphaera aphanis]|nr:hypothetical protein K3495_g5700 [Podosphaera aphanis]
MVNGHTAQETQDELFAECLTNLKPNTLQKFETLPDDFNTHRPSNCSIGLKTLLALNHHSHTLRSLKLCCADQTMAENLHRPHDCRNLSILRLSFPPGAGPDMKTTEGEIASQDLIDWICSCRNFRKFLVGESYNGTEILTQVCSKEWIRLTKLEVAKTQFAISGDFFAALATQTSLEYLRIGGNISLKRMDASYILSKTIPCLTNLKVLDISSYHKHEFSGDYSKTAIITIISNLAHLESLMFSCELATDELWPTMKCFPRLRILYIDGTSDFTYNGILGYIKSLQPTNEGLQLSIITHDPMTQFVREDRLPIRRVLRKKFGGYFRMGYTNVQF